MRRKEIHKFHVTKKKKKLTRTNIELVFNISGLIYLRNLKITFLTGTMFAV